MGKKGNEARKSVHFSQQAHDVARRGESPAAVSYTHLDVYKRQDKGRDGNVLLFLLHALSGLLLFASWTMRRLSSATISTPLSASAQNLYSVCYLIQTVGMGASIATPNVFFNNEPRQDQKAKLSSC